MSEDFLTQALLLASASSSVTGGRPGTSHQAGTKKVGISDGPKRSEWNYSSELSFNTTRSQDSKSSATTSGSSKAGGQAGAETRKQTEFFEGFTNYWKSTTQFSSRDMSTPRTTPQTARPEGSTPHNTTDYPPSSSQKNSNPSSATSTPQPTSTDQLLLDAFLLNQKQQYPPTNASGDNKRTLTQTNIQTTQTKRPRLTEALNKRTSTRKQNIATRSQQHADPDTLVTRNFNPRHSSLKESQLRPDCPAGERIKEWKPANARHTLDDDGQPTNLVTEDLERIQDVLQETYAKKTRSTYRTGLLVFHVFCDEKDINEEHRAPVNQTVLSSFISNLIGTYGGDSIKNYVYGIRAWHIIHGVKWKVNDDEVDALLKAGRKLSPKEARQREKKPWTVKYLTKICGFLVKDDPRDAAILACLTTAFWGTARLGEVTVPNLKAFDPNVHVKLSNVEFNVQDRNRLEETVIFLPWTKATKEKGEKIFWAKQNGIVNPLLRFWHVFLHFPRLSPKRPSMSSKTVQLQTRSFHHTLFTFLMFLILCLSYPIPLILSHHLNRHVIDF